jgi:hypothetical protein
MLVSGIPDISFKKQNPHLSNFISFKAIYDNNKLEIADKICWCIAYLEDPDKDENPYTRYLREDRIEELKINIYSKFDPKDELIKEACDAYINLLPLEEERMYAIHKKKASEFSSIINNLDLDKEADLEKYTKYSPKLDSIWKNLKKIENDLQSAKSKKTKKVRWR